jgi:3-hydroxybutyryl-CoA dehydrogenase
MVALPLKEQPGYIVNSLLVPLLSAGLDLLVKVLRMFILSIKHGWWQQVLPQTFAILDVVGITTAYINKMEAEKTDKQKVVEYLKEHFIDKEMGVATGEFLYLSQSCVQRR